MGTGQEEGRCELAFAKKRESEAVLHDPPLLQLQEVEPTRPVLDEAEGPGEEDGD